MFGGFQNKLFKAFLISFLPVFVPQCIRMNVFWGKMRTLVFQPLFSQSQKDFEGREGVDWLSFKGQWGMGMRHQNTLEMVSKLILPN